MKRVVLVLLSIAGALCGLPPARAQLPAVTPVPFNQVSVTDNFWAPKIEINRTVTVPHMFQECEAHDRIDNFRKAAGLMAGSFVGPVYNDSDVYKTLEGAAYSLRVHPDPALETYCDNLIDLIGQAQWSDGYLDTLYSCPHDPAGRWSNVGGNHELYCAGHFLEAAVAYYQTTGHTKVLDIATSLAQCLLNTFGPGKNMHPPGHEEVEIGLVKLYKLTGDVRYLNLAKFFIDQRGNAAGHPLYGSYAQDQAPVVDQTQAVGHAVRAGYLYTGTADVAILTSNTADVHALDTIWDNVATKKYYITGGVGASPSGEAYGANYSLPNATAYCETCAAVACVLWNERMFEIHDDARYLDMLERTLYNGVLSGVSLSGDLFFYPNPLASAGGYTRSPWFGTPCCPGNIVRIIPQVPGFAYAHKDDTLYVNLFMTSETTVTLPAARVRIDQQTGYPWSDNVHLTLDPDAPATFTLAVRVPCWALGRPVPDSDLYHFATDYHTSPTLAINGTTVPLSLDHGFARLTRRWQPGDVVELTLPMPVRRVLANDAVAADANRVAYLRGPFTYCAEGVDNPSAIDHIVIPSTATLTAHFEPSLLNGVEALQGQVEAISVTSDPFGGTTVQSTPTTVTLIPYNVWANRGGDTMAVWLAANPSTIPVPPPVGHHLTTLLTFDEAGGTVAADTSRHGGDNSGTLYNAPTFAPYGGRRAGALTLDGTNQYVGLPADVTDVSAITVATWVNWSGGAGWARIFDFGNDTSKTMFLTPKSSASTMRLAITTGGSGAEQQLNTAMPPIGQWVHVAVTIGGGVGVMYVNGVEVARNDAMTIRPYEIGGSSNYLGRSHYSADPYLQGSLDDFRVYNYALSADEIATLYHSYDAASIDHPPFFVNDLVTLSPGHASYPYQASIQSLAADPDVGDTLTFSLAGGPVWLHVSANGTLSGTPPTTGWQVMTVRVSDTAGDWDQAVMRLWVDPTIANAVAPWAWLGY